MKRKGKGLDILKEGPGSRGEKKDKEAGEGATCGSQERRGFPT